MSKKVSSIVIQTIVGITFMWIALRYLNNHPAEKVGIFSTFDFIYQKVSSVSKMFHGRSKSDVNDLDQFKTSFKELKQVLSTTACQRALQAKDISTDVVDQIIQALDSTTSDEFARERSKYVAVFSKLNTEINKYCK
ncbi:MAG: hypothetical protein WC004_03100 [Candidatus Absconditabacterales bacterium]